MISSVCSAQENKIGSFACSIYLGTEDQNMAKGQTIHPVVLILKVQIFCPLKCQFWGDGRFSKKKGRTFDAPGRGS